MKRLFTVLVVILGCLLPPLLSAQPGMRGGPRTKGRPGPSGLRMVERLNAMPAEERSRVLGDLPPKRRAELEKGLERYQKLSPEEREKLSHRFRTFQKLSPAQREAMRDSFRRMNALPDDRRDAVRREMADLRQLSPEARQSRFASGEFKEKYSQEEREIMENLSRAIPDDTK